MSRDNAMDRWLKVGSDTFIAQLVVAGPGEECTAIEVLLRATDRREASRRLHDLGHHSVRFKGDHGSPLDEDVAAILTSAEETLWRPFGADEQWRPLPVEL
jgi:hypothetical protein